MVNKNNKGFTLIETLVAVTVLTVAVSAPLSLAAQSLLAAFNSRDQVVAFHLAQEAVETVRAQRDHNILRIVKSGQNVHWLEGIPVETLDLNGNIDERKPFLVDSISSTKNFELCRNSDPNSCDMLQFNPNTGFYGHDFGGPNRGKPSRFRRFVRVTEVPDTNSEEVIVRSEVQWRTGRFGGVKSVIIQENLFKWISGITTDREENNDNNNQQ